MLHGFHGYVLFAPVENPGKPLFERVRIVNKRKTLIITLMVIIISLSIRIKLPDASLLFW